MNSRKAFTLIELLTVIGLLALLAAILVPVIGTAQRSAAIAAQKLDFQSIATALEAYRSDFGDYPRNTILPTWNVTANGVAPAYLSLAAALIGPGPGVTMSVNGQIQNGDGAYGYGFRSRTMNIPVTVSGSVLTFPVGVTLPTFVPDQSAWVFVDSITNIIYGIRAVTAVTVGPPPTFTVSTWAGATPSGNPGVLRIATGKVWGPYLPSEKFTVQFIDPATGVPPASATIIGQPILLDHWGQPIQYFTRFGPANNRTSDSTIPGGTDPTVAAGPLYGYSIPYSIDKTYGLNAMWDWRDGIPVTVRGIASTTWQSPPATPGNPDLSMAFRWMLGDEPVAANTPPQDNVIRAPESLRYSGPYILISAGPYSTWCDLTTARPDSIGYKKAFLDSGNIYNFDR